MPVYILNKEVIANREPDFTFILMRGGCRGVSAARAEGKNLKEYRGACNICCYAGNLAAYICLFMFVTCPADGKSFYARGVRSRRSKLKLAPLPRQPPAGLPGT